VADRDGAAANIERMDESLDQLVVLHGMSWQQYEQIARARGKQPYPRLAYLDGSLEIMTTGTQHELDKIILDRLLVAWSEELEIDLNGLGSPTFRSKAKRAGLEPDTCYWLGAVPVPTAPDLGIEIVKTHGGVDRLEVYKRLGVREVWFWKDYQFEVFLLRGIRYERAQRSRVLPSLDLAVLAHHLAEADPTRQREAVLAYRRALRRRR